jgi:hypothetical protein
MIVIVVRITGIRCLLRRILLNGSTGLLFPTDEDLHGIDRFLVLSSADLPIIVTGNIADSSVSPLPNYSLFGIKLVFFLFLFFFV